MKKVVEYVYAVLSTRATMHVFVFLDMANVVCSIILFHCSAPSNRGLALLWFLLHSCSRTICTSDDTVKK